MQPFDLIQIFLSGIIDVVALLPLDHRTDTRAGEDLVEKSRVRNDVNLADARGNGTLYVMR